MKNKFKALCGADYIRDRNWNPILKTKKGWELYSSREAKRKSKAENFAWTGVLFFVEQRNAYRINYGSMSIKNFN